jgi:S1-C subfamily serine protease
MGTAFVVSGIGHLLTNEHVVSGCREIETREGTRLQIVLADPSVDLAVLSSSMLSEPVAKFRSGTNPSLGESVVVFGFPLPGLLSNDGNVTTGAISALSGLRDDARYLQITAPVQPGNSGGPLLDMSGNVVGVVVAKLDAAKVAKVTGDIPQNINFAVALPEILAFLSKAGIAPQKEPSTTERKFANIAATAKAMSTQITCTKK